MKLKTIRSTFLDFFARQSHTIVPSASLVPGNDPSLMFTTAGMVQFKNYFVGAETPKFSRATSSQKCVRAGGKHNDLENVGYTARHHTFFEMLGNFSFGDYFKEDAIEMAWKCLTQEFAIDKDKLYVTVYHTDDEAFNIWKKLTGFSDDRIIRIPTSDNFWSMGEVGPCGPCSEIFYDHGDKLSGGLPGAPDEGGDRYVEIWNLVFMQYEDMVGGQRVSLPKPSIDTGMGIERFAAVLQGTHHNYEIDLFKDLIANSNKLFDNKSKIETHRVIADHIRAISFLIADGVMPSNEGRGYVLRRIMRRAMRHGYQLGKKEPLLYKLAPELVRLMGEDYTELKRASDLIYSTIHSEEERFLEMLDKGIKILDEQTASLSSGGKLNGEVAFKLYDTYGFPLDLTSDVLKAKNITVDTEVFEEKMQEQKVRARAMWTGSGEKVADSLWLDLRTQIGATEFLGYNTIESEAVVKAIVRDGKLIDFAEDEEVMVILNQTPFYAESGGQIGDKGSIDLHEVKDTKKQAGDIFAHIVKLVGPLKIGQAVVAKIDNTRRLAIQANHSATHLLHKALRDRLGLHIAQKGSLVSHDRLRFDFSHTKSLSAGELKDVEHQVYVAIQQNSKVITELMQPEKAIEIGAMALFGEKYGDEVRVVTMGDSKELCGGTHVEQTGNIGICKVIAEQAVASGIRRIEALTGQVAIDYISAQEQMLKSLAEMLKCNTADLPLRLSSLIEDRKKLERDFSNLRINSISHVVPAKFALGSGELIVYSLEDALSSDLRPMIEQLKAKGVKLPLMIINSSQNILSVVLSIVDECLNASEIIKDAAAAFGGSGGGKKDFAQAGNIPSEKKEEFVLKIVKSFS